MSRLYLQNVTKMRLNSLTLEIPRTSDLLHPSADVTRLEEPERITLKSNRMEI